MAISGLVTCRLRSTASSSSRPAIRLQPDDAAPVLLRPRQADRLLGLAIGTPVLLAVLWLMAPWERSGGSTSGCSGAASTCSSCSSTRPGSRRCSTSSRRLKMRAQARIEALLTNAAAFASFRPLRHGRLEALEPRQRLLHRLRQHQAHRLLRHPAQRLQPARRSRPCWRTNWATSSIATRQAHRPDLRHVAAFLCLLGQLIDAPWFYAGPRCAGAEHGHGADPLLPGRAGLHLPADTADEPAVAPHEFEADATPPNTPPPTT
jgi:hypothetical protein